MAEKINVLLDWSATFVVDGRDVQYYVERNENAWPIMRDLRLTDEQYDRLGEPESVNVTIEGVL